MTKQEFAQKLKQKRRDWADIPDDVLVEQVIKKYPQYQRVLQGQPIETQSVIEPQQQPQQQPQQSRIQETIEDVKQTGSSIKNRFLSGAEKFKSIFSRQKTGEQNVGSTALQLAGTSAGVAEDIMGDLFTGVVKGFLEPEAEQKVKSAVTNIAGGVLNNPAISPAVKSSVSYFQSLSPEVQENLSSVFNIGMLGLDIAGLGLGGKGVKATGKATKEIVGEGLEAGVKKSKRVFDATKGVLPAVKTPVEKIATVISPKLTAKEIRIALSQGRVVRSGKLAKVFGIPEKVKLDKRVLDAAETINRRITNATKMTDQEIANVAKTEIASISKKLEPKLKKIELLDEAKDNILNSWADLKQTQIDDFTFSSPSAIKKQQAKFEKVLLDVIDADNVDDLWKSIQKYDDTVKKSIKDSTSMSSENAQELKDIWLDSRRVLRDALDDVANNIDDVGVSSEFKDMSNLYMARQNIINSANLSKGNKDLLRQILLRVGIPATAGAVGFKLFD